MSDFITVTCPKCCRVIRIAAQHAGAAVKCKVCATIVKTERRPPPAPKSVLAFRSPKASTEKPAAAVAPQAAAHPPATVIPETEIEVNPYLERMRKRRRFGALLVMANLAFLAAVAGVLAWVFREQLSQMAEQFAKLREANAAPATAPRTKLSELGNIDPNEGSTPDPVRRPGRPGIPEAKPMPARIPRPYPGRALLVGVQNYLYLAPTNVAQERDQAGVDPLGLAVVARTLVHDLSFETVNVGHLSDAAESGAVAPTREVIEKAIEAFFSSCKPPDRAVLVLVGHMVWAKDQGYFLPIDAELPDAKEPSQETLAKLIPMAWIHDQAAKSPARQKVLVWDVAPRHPQMTSARPAPPAMSKELHAALAQPPAGVQAWISCGVDQFATPSRPGEGSLFLRTITRLTDWSEEANWSRLEKHPQFKSGSLPWTLLAEAVNAETAKDAKEEWQAKQTPVLVGNEPTFDGRIPEKYQAGPVVLPAVKAPSGTDRQLVEGIMKELGITEDPLRRLRAEALAPLTPELAQKYAEGDSAGSAFKGELAKNPMRQATVEAVQLLSEKRPRSELRLSFRNMSNEAQFRRFLESEQEIPATLMADFSYALDTMKQAGKKRDQETAARWQAHFDYVQARLLGKLIEVQEYNFVVGNKLRKDLPALKDSKAHNGWKLVPQTKLEQKETRELRAERDKLLDKLIKEHAGTPWEILAKRERGLALSFELVEAKVE
jgi:hypothetical protein